MGIKDIDFTCEIVLFSAEFIIDGYGAFQHVSAMYGDHKGKKEKICSQNTKEVR